MIDLYTWNTPNGRKVSILLEELGLDYTAHSVNIGAGDQNTTEFLKISPSGLIQIQSEQDFDELRKTSGYQDMLKKLKLG